MAAPAEISRTEPAGFKLEDGHQALIAFQVNADAMFWELEVQPPIIDGGDPIETTTQHNAALRTFSPQSLYTLEPHTVRVAYDPCINDEIIDGMVNMNDSITVHYPDGSTFSFWGYLKRFEPDPMVRGEMPTATITVVPTNYDPYNCVEAPPVIVCAGTC